MALTEVSHKECFFINSNHRFKYVKYALGFIISSEVCDRCLLKDRGKFLWAKEQLYKPEERMLLDFLHVRVISAYLYAVLSQCSWQNVVKLN